KLVGVDVAMGRGFKQGDDAVGAPLVCVLQHETWQNVFGSDPAILGKAIVLNNAPHTVVGVLPKGFRFVYDEVEVWMPHHSWPPFSSGNTYLNRAAGLVGPLARLKQGVTPQQAQLELDTISKRLSSQYPQAGEGRRITSLPLRDSVVAN